MSRSSLVISVIFIFVIISAGLLYAQDLPPVFDQVLSDVSQREGRTIQQADLLDYRYSEVYDDFYAECGVEIDPWQTRYYIIILATDQLRRYTYHATTDGTRVVVCSFAFVEPTATPTVDLTRFTATPTLIPTATETPRFGAMRCEGFLYSRLRVGEQGRVLDGEPNILRESPDPTSAQLRVIPSGVTFDVLDGPECDSSGRAWWQVRYLNTVGWTVEGEGEDYYVEPVITSLALFPTNTPVSTAYPTLTPLPTSCPASPAPRLVPYGWGRVTPGDPNNIRRSPSVSAYIVAVMPAGATFRVSSRLPSCDDMGRAWWQVNYDGNFGWTVEGEGDTYYLEPISEAEAN